MAEKIKSSIGILAHRVIGPKQTISFHMWAGGDTDFGPAYFFGAYALSADNYFAVNRTLDYVGTQDPITTLGAANDGTQFEVSPTFVIPKTGAPFNEIIQSRDNMSYNMFNRITSYNPIVISRIMLNTTAKFLWRELVEIVTFNSDFSNVKRNPYNITEFNIPTEERSEPGQNGAYDTAILDSEIIISATSGFYIKTRDSAIFRKGIPLIASFEFYPIKI
mgnify:CR=1 FL=1